MPNILIPDLFSGLFTSIAARTAEPFRSEASAYEFKKKKYNSDLLLYISYFNDVQDKSKTKMLKT